MLAPANYCFLHQELFFCLQAVKMLQNKLHALLLQTISRFFCRHRRHLEVVPLFLYVASISYDITTGSKSDLLIFSLFCMFFGWRKRQRMVFSRTLAVCRSTRDTQKCIKAMKKCILYHMSSLTEGVQMMRWRTGDQKCRGIGIWMPLFFLPSLDALGLVFM